jgi:hypothetical protein
MPTPYHQCNYKYYWLSFTTIEAEDNQKFIAMMHNMFPNLVAEIERLQRLEASDNTEA